MELPLASGNSMQTTDIRGFYFFVLESSTKMHTTTCQHFFATHLLSFLYENYSSIWFEVADCSKIFTNFYIHFYSILVCF